MALSPYEQLEQEFRRLHAFRGALSLLRWDAAVMMPRGSADVRGEQLAALETEHHALLTTPKVPPPPPFKAQNRSGLVHAFAIRIWPSAVTTSASSKLPAAVP